MFFVDPFPVCLDLALADVEAGPVWVEFGGEGVPVARDV